MLGPKHPGTVICMNNLAETYGLRGQYAPAETLFSKTLAVSRRVLGPEHPLTDLCLRPTLSSNLDASYWKQTRPLLRSARTVEGTLLFDPASPEAGALLPSLRPSLSCTNGRASTP